MMQSLKKEVNVAIIILVALALPILTQDELPTNNIIKRPDAIVIKGDLLKKFHGYPIDNFGLFRYYSERWEPIPFQIDERDSQGLLALPQGTKPTFDEQSDKIFDENDEVVLMCNDLGDRVEQNLWLKESFLGAEIEVEDPLTGDKGWAYCFLFQNPPPLSHRDYINIQLKEESWCIEAFNYTIGFQPARIYFTQLILNNNEEEGERTNILDRTKFRSSVRLKWWLFYFLALKSFKKNEENVDMRIASYKDGAVRLILRGKPKVKLIMNWELPSEELDSFYYYNQIKVASLISSPVNLSSYCMSASFRAGFDFNRNSMGMYFYNCNNSEPNLIDGKMDNGELHLDLSHQNWMVLTGPQGTIINRVVLGPSLEMLRNKLYYMDNANLPDLPEGEKGQYPQIGYSFSLLPIKEGKHKIFTYLYFPSHFEPGEEVRYLNILDHPLKIAVR